MPIDERIRHLAEPRLAWRLVAAGCLVYAVSFLAFYPRVVTNEDESMYRRQAILAIQGMAEIFMIEPVSGEEVIYRPSRYPPGTALSMAPFVAVFGWQGMYVVPLLSLLLAVWVMARWLSDEGRSPLFALLLLGYPPALVMGRVGMSDVPSMAVVTVGLWLFWRGIDGGFRWWLASGFVAGASMAFRDSNPICFAPFFAGALLRRDRHWWALLAGGLAGLGVRLGSYGYFLGDPLYRRSFYVLALDSVPERLPLYLVATLVFVPGGLLLVLCYRGRRWPELVSVVAAFFAAYLIQRNYTFSTSVLKNLFNTPRYLLPLVPMMVFGMAESAPRLWAGLVGRADPERRRGLERWRPRAVAAWAGAVILAAACVHPASYLWSLTQGRIRDAIAEVIGDDDVLVTNLLATRKFIDDLDRIYYPVDSRKIDPEDANALVARYGEIYVVFLDRTDSDWWRRDAELNARFVEGLAPEPVLLVDEQASPTDRLRIWRVTREGPAAARP
jgi:hypothetical protein